MSGVFPDGLAFQAIVGRHYGLRDDEITTARLEAGFFDRSSHRKHGE